ncbi:MAG: DUF4160 domain-containing protein [Caldilinea sp.]
MPEISRFYGIIIAMYYNEHGLPHFHAKYGGQTAVFTISDLHILEGQLPRRVRGLVLEWAFEHRAELMENWTLSQAKKPMKDIAPLE